jgi:hypothetical protein
MADEAAEMSDDADDMDALLGLGSDEEDDASGASAEEAMSVALKSETAEAAQLTDETAEETLTGVADLMAAELAALTTNSAEEEEEEEAEEMAEDEDEETAFSEESKADVAELMAAELAALKEATAKEEEEEEKEEEEAEEEKEDYGEEFGDIGEEFGDYWSGSAEIDAAAGLIDNEAAVFAAPENVLTEEVPAQLASVVGDLAEDTTALTEEEMAELTTFKRTTTEEAVGVKKAMELAKQETFTEVAPWQTNRETPEMEVYRAEATTFLTAVETTELAAVKETHEDATFDKRFKQEPPTAAGKGNAADITPSLSRKQSKEKKRGEKDSKKRAKKMLEGMRKLQTLVDSSRELRHVWKLLDPQREDSCKLSQVEAWVLEHLPELQDSQALLCTYQAVMKAGDSQKGQLGEGQVSAGEVPVVQRGELVGLFQGLLLHMQVHAIIFKGNEATGDVSLSSFCDCVRQKGVPMSQADAVVAFASLDEPGLGQVDFSAVFGWFFNKIINPTPTMPATKRRSPSKKPVLEVAVKSPAPAMPAERNTDAQREQLVKYQAQLKNLNNTNVALTKKLKEQVEGTAELVQTEVEKIMQEQGQPEQGWTANQEIFHLRNQVKFLNKSLDVETRDRNIQNAAMSRLKEVAADFKHERKQREKQGSLNDGPHMQELSNEIVEKNAQLYELQKEVKTLNIALRQQDKDAAASVGPRASTPISMQEKMDRDIDAFTKRFEELAKQRTRDEKALGALTNKVGQLTDIVRRRGRRVGQLKDTLKTHGIDAPVDPDSPSAKKRRLQAEQDAVAAKAKLNRAPRLPMVGLRNGPIKRSPAKPMSTPSKPKVTPAKPNLAKTERRPSPMKAAPKPKPHTYSLQASISNNNHSKSKATPPAKPHSSHENSSKQAATASPIAASTAGEEEDSYAEDEDAYEDDYSDDGSTIEEAAKPPSPPESEREEVLEFVSEPPEPKLPKTKLKIHDSIHDDMDDEMDFSGDVDDHDDYADDFT